jgi:hypothetical protein
MVIWGNVGGGREWRDGEQKRSKVIRLSRYQVIKLRNVGLDDQARMQGDGYSCSLEEARRRREARNNPARKRAM